MTAISPFAAAGVVPSQGSWLRTTAGWREQILTWYAQGPRACDWRSNAEFFDAFEPARKNAGISKTSILVQLRNLVGEGLLEKRIDYDRHPNPASRLMPYVEHRAVAS